MEIESYVSELTSHSRVVRKSPLFGEVKVGLSSQPWAFGSTEIVQNCGGSAALDCGTSDSKL